MALSITDLENVNKKTGNEYIIRPLQDNHLIHRER